MGEVRTRAYFRIRVDDRTGVLAALGQVFAEEGVSISSLIQKDAWVDEQTAELVVTTHPAPWTCHKGHNAPMTGAPTEREEHEGK